MVRAYDIGRLMHTLEMRGLSCYMVHDLCDIEASVIACALAAHLTNDMETLLPIEAIAGLARLTPEHPSHAVTLAPERSRTRVYQFLCEITNCGVDIVDVASLTGVTIDALLESRERLTIKDLIAICDKMPRLRDAQLEILRKRAVHDHRSIPPTLEATSHKRDTENTLLASIRGYIKKTGVSDIERIAEAFDMTADAVRRLDEIYALTTSDDTRKPGRYRFQRPYACYMAEHPDATVMEAANALGCSSTTIKTARRALGMGRHAKMGQQAETAKTSKTSKASKVSKASKSKDATRGQDQGQTTTVVATAVA
jgi:hypothetical protein